MPFISTGITKMYDNIQKTTGQELEKVQFLLSISLMHPLFTLLMMNKFEQSHSMNNIFKTHFEMLQ